MVFTVSSLGIILVVLIVIFILNKRRLIFVHYPDALHNDELKNGQFSLLSYNVAGLPEKISSAKTKRHDSMLLIGELINDYDIVNVQEDFNYNIQLYTNNKHPFKTAHRGKAVWGDGLNTFSRFPIKEFRRVAWKKCNGSDCLTPKGFSLARVYIAKGISVDVYNVHATSGNSPSAAKARQQNLLQLASYIQDHSANNPLIVMGDFNAHYQFELDNMQEFLALTQLQDSWVLTILQGVYPVVQPDFKIISDLECNDYIESIDKILFRNSSHLLFEPISFKIDLDSFLNENKEHLSDHLPVVTEIRWQAV